MGKTPEEHNQNLEALLQRIKELGLTLNRKKCEFAKESLTFFGVVLTKEGVRADTQKVGAIDEMMEPRSAAELRSFLQSWSKIMRLMTNFTGK